MKELDLGRLPKASRSSRGLEDTEGGRGERRLHQESSGLVALLAATGTFSVAGRENLLEDVYHWG